MSNVHSKQKAAAQLKALPIKMALDGFIRPIYKHRSALLEHTCIDGHILHAQGT